MSKTPKDEAEAGKRAAEILKHTRPDVFEATAARPGDLLRLEEAIAAPPDKWSMGGGRSPDDPPPLGLPIDRVGEPHPAPILTVDELEEPVAVDTITYHKAQLAKALGIPIDRLPYRLAEEIEEPNDSIETAIRKVDHEIADEVIRFAQWLDDELPGVRRETEGAVACAYRLIAAAKALGSERWRRLYSSVGVA
jgi:hypothetical protein